VEVTTMLYIKLATKKITRYDIHISCFSNLLLKLKLISGRDFYVEIKQIDELKFILTYLSLLLSFTCYAQDKNRSQLSLMQGVWEYNMNTDSEKAFSIIRGKLSLSFVYNVSGELDFPLHESLKGFYDGDISVDTMFVDSLHDSGLHYVTIDKDDIKSEGWVTRPDFLTPRYFECDGEIMSINGGQLVEYLKINELPYEALVKLFKRGKLDKRDYIFEYLNLRVRSIKSSYCKIYSNPKEKANGKLEREQVVIILEENAKWLKVKYSEDGIGWIKKTHVEF
jgi:hypothetical protein